MAFNPNDIYTSSGSVMLFNSWTPYVSKFDTSTFYNWEQDNVPLYDLEERTYELWEQGGYATSAGVPGLALTVSSDASPESFEADSNLFSDLSSAIAAIPKVVRFPVLVEVGNYTDIGPLELHNFRIEEEGSIEIINRCFARTYNASSDVRTAAVPSVGSYLVLPTQISSLDLSNTINDTECVHIGSNVFVNGGADTRLTQVNSVFFPSHDTRKTALAVTLEDGNFITSTQNEFAPNVFENQSTDLTISSFDISSADIGSNYLRRSQVTTGTEIGGNIYGNTCTKISVKNCDGPIYIRNFFVDGGTVRPVGIEVNNSKVLLENCSVMRAQESGFKFVNSEVTLSRSAFAYRNYKIDENDVTLREPELGTGFRLVNSDVLVSSLGVSALSSVGDFGAEGRDATVIASRNTRGFVLENSTIRGGVKRSEAADAKSGGVLCSELNTSAGILLNNSRVDLKGLVDVYGNSVGVRSNNSILKFENLTVDGNQNEGIASHKSTFHYDSDEIQETVVRRQLDLSANSVHLDLDGGSTFDFKLKNLVPSSYGNSFFRQSFGPGPAIKISNNSNLDLLKPYIEVTNTTNNPPVSYGRAIKTINGSTATLNGAGNGATLIVGPGTYSTQKNMAGVCAEKNSSVSFHGPTAIAQFAIDVLAKDNSIMNFEPRRIDGGDSPDVDSFDLSSRENHTSVELHSTRSCLVAQKNSTINIKDLGSYPTNWSTTASGADILGQITQSDYTALFSNVLSAGSMQFFANPQVTAAPASIGSYALPLTPKSLDRNNLLLIKDGGFSAPDYPLRQTISLGGVCLRAVEDSVVNVNNVHFPVPPNASPADGLFFDSAGDECNKFNIWNIADSSRLKASFVSLSGTHPISSEQHGPSAIYMSSNDTVFASGAPLGTPDTGSLSILDAFGAGSSVWIVPSGVDVNSEFERFYPVSGVVNDSTARSLSQAGINVSGTRAYDFGVSGAFNNRGSFRLYWSPKSSARLLQSDATSSTDFSGVVGPAYQIFAQGYNCSGPLSAIVPTGYQNASAVAPDLLKLSYDSDGDGVYDQLWTSGFYYCSEILEENPTQCTLEESAADMFANARNASVGLAGRPRKTTIYSERNQRNGESYSGDFIQGFKSASIFDLERDN